MSVPLNHGGWLDQHDGVQTAWPHPVKPKPDYTVDRGEVGASGTLATQDRQLVLERENLELQFRAAPKPTGEPRHGGRNESEHAGDTTAAKDKSLDFSTLSEFLVWRGESILFSNCARLAPPPARSDRNVLVPFEKKTGQRVREIPRQPVADW